MLVKKNYIRIAKLFKEVRPTKDIIQLNLKLVDYFKEDNPNFDDQKFLRACKL